MNSKIFIIPLSLFLLTVILNQLKSTAAYFSDTVSVSGNTFTMGVWTTPITTPTPTTIPAPAAGDVVINELMWMGSTQSSSDEWIELRNRTNRQIEITGWIIEGAGDSSDSITLSGSIPANSYFVISHYTSGASAISNLLTVDQVAPGISLNNSGEQLVLKDNLGNVIDQILNGSWPAGYSEGTSSGLHQSMERDNDPSLGWHTCTNNSCNDTNYWDSEGNNYGTPKANNIYE